MTSCRPSIRLRYSGERRTSSQRASGRAVERLDLFEQRDDAQPGAGEALEARDRQDVRRRLGHRDDVSAERLGMQLGDRLEVSSVVRDLSGGCRQARHFLRRLLAQPFDEEGRSPLLAPFGVRPDTPLARDRVERAPCVARRAAGCRAATSVRPNAASRRRRSASRPSAMICCPVSTSER